MNDLYERLAAVEKQNRNLRMALTAIGCGLFVTVAAAAVRQHEIHDTIQAKRIELVDQDGAPLVVISDEDGRGKITTLSSKGAKLVDFGSDSSGTGNLAVYGPKGTAIVNAGHDANHGNGVFARNGGEKICAGIIASPQGYGTLVVCNHDEQTVGWLVGNEKGGSLFLNDAKGGALVIATAAADTGKGAMVIKSQEGKIVSRLPQ